MARRPVKVVDTDGDDDGESIFGDNEVPVSEKNVVMNALEGVGNAFAAFRPASEVLTRVRSVPTIFPGLDWATRVGGLPIERFTLVHGPSGEGKTKLTIGLLLSFLMRKHLACLIDAERTTPITWLETAMGPYAKSPAFFAERPKTYEATVKYVREFLNTLRKLRMAGKVASDTSAIIVVDSIRKLVPEDIFARIMASAKLDLEDSRGKSGNGKQKKERVGRDRGAQIKAAMNSAWMDELIPLLEEAQAGMVVIARETADPDADQNARMWGNDFKVGGGKALYYDASLVMRVEKQRDIYKERSEAEKEAKVKGVIYGERHRVTIRKSKVAGKEDAVTSWYFHDSNGVLVPEGFDKARDLVELARRFDMLKMAGGWMSWQNARWQGEHNAVKALHKKPELLERFEEAVRLRFDSVNPVDSDALTGEILT